MSEMINGEGEVVEERVVESERGVGDDGRRLEYVHEI